MDRLDTHENFPAGFREYLENYGWHFSKKMCEFAVSRMKDRNGKKIEPYSKDKVDALLKQYGIELKKDKGYDCVYVCNMALSDYFGSSIPTMKTDTTACHLHATMPIPSAREHPFCGKR